MHRTTIAGICAAALMASGCSTKPRQFSAQVRPVAEPVSTAGLPQGEAAVFSSCDGMVRSGRKGEFASAAASTGAATAAVLGSVAGVAASGTVGIGASTAGYALMTAVPFVGIAAGLGMNRLIRGGRERGYRKHMTTCLAEMGYEVAQWDRAGKKQTGTATLVPVVRQADRVGTEQASDASPDTENALSVPPAPVG